MKTYITKLIILLTITVIVGCLPAPLVTIEGTYVYPSGSRTEETIKDNFTKSVSNIINCFKINDTVLSIGKTWDVIFLNDTNGNMYLYRINEPGTNKHYYLYPKSLSNCISVDNWNDSITGIQFNTIICSRLSRVSKDSIRIDTITIQYSSCKGRTKKSIQKIVMKNIKELRVAYKRKKSQGLKKSGTVTVKFAVDEFGKVIFCKTMSSAIKNLEFENQIESIIRKWEFPEIIRPGDVTEIVYPFEF